MGQGSGVRRWLLPLTIFAATGLALSVTGLVLVAGRRADPNASRVLEPDLLCAGLNVPEFSMVDQSGTPTTQAALVGRVTVLDFVFTNCPFICPGMMVAMKGLCGELAGTPVRFMSISVDPAHDTPERLREYAADHGADLTRWSFLTGEQAMVERIVRDALQFELQPDPSREIGTRDGSKMANITHPGKLLLIGPDLRVLGLYDPNDVEQMRRLVFRARRAGEALRSGP
jgi:protein SCO1/2